MKKNLDHGGDATPDEMKELYKDWLNEGQPSASIVGTELGVAACIGVYEGIKWSIAGFLAPETLGGSLLGAVVLP